LGPIFGAENVNVAVSADLNFDSIQKETGLDLFQIEPVFKKVKRFLPSG